MCSCHSILECCVTFSGVKLSIRSFVLFRVCTSSGKLGICRVGRPVLRDRRILINSWKWRRVSQLCISHVASLLLIF